MTNTEPEPEEIFSIPFAERIGRTALVAGTYDTKGPELRFIRERLAALGIPVKTVDLSTSGKPSTADVSPMQVASMHRGGSSAVFNGDRGQSVAAMAEAFGRWIERERGIGGIISAGGSGATTLPTAEARETKRKLARPAVGITMFGVTTPCVQAVQKRLEAHYDCFVFHATGTGGRSMENLADSGLLSAFLGSHDNGSGRYDRRRCSRGGSGPLWRGDPHRASFCRIGRRS